MAKYSTIASFAVTLGMDAVISGMNKTVDDFADAKGDSVASGYADIPDSFSDKWGLSYENN